jgi:hypothetical protein
MIVGAGLPLAMQRNVTSLPSSARTCGSVSVSSKTGGPSDNLSHQFQSQFITFFFGFQIDSTCTVITLLLHQLTTAVH